MAEALADRLAEAFAEFLHKRAREEWGFGKVENLKPEDLIEEKYRGIRPAAGYPACPDHTEKEILWKLLDVEKNAGIKLTESFAMWPGSSVSGLYFAHPEFKIFRRRQTRPRPVAGLSFAERHDVAGSRALARPVAELRPGKRRFSGFLRLWSSTLIKIAKPVSFHAPDKGCAGKEIYLSTPLSNETLNSMSENKRRWNFSRRERIWLAVGICLLIGFGACMERRTALRRIPMTDLGVFAVASEAVWSGQNPYMVTDWHGWHYQYPPTLAILFLPLAEPVPKGLPVLKPGELYTETNTPWGYEISGHPGYGHGSYYYGLHDQNRRFFWIVGAWFLLSVRSFLFPHTPWPARWKVPA